MAPAASTDADDRDKDRGAGVVLVAIRDHVRPGRAIRRRAVNATTCAPSTATRATRRGHRPDPRDRAAAVAVVAAGDRALAATGQRSRPARTTVDALIRNTSTAAARDQRRHRARTRPMRLRALPEARKEPFPSAAAAAAGAIEAARRALRRGIKNSGRHLTCKAPAALVESGFVAGVAQR